MLRKDAKIVRTRSGRLATSITSLLSPKRVEVTNSRRKSIDKKKDLTKPANEAQAVKKNAKTDQKLPLKVSRVTRSKIEESKRPLRKLIARKAVPKEPETVRNNQRKPVVLKESTNITGINKVKNPFWKQLRVNVGRRIRIDEVPVESPVAKKELRKRITRDYTEISFENSPVVKPQLPATQHVPIYLQRLENKKSEKKVDDLYAFDDSDSSTEKKRALKGRKIKKKLDDSGNNVYDKSMQKAVRKIRNKIEKPKGRNLKSNRNILVASTKRPVKPQKMPVKPQKMPVIKEKVDEDLESDRDNDEAHSESDSEPFLGFDNGPTTSKSVQKVQESLEKTPKRVNIISNVRITSNNTKSTNVLERSWLDRCSTVTNSPWRSDDLPLRRNPHFLHIKESALPYYDQEMVLDASIVEKAEASRTPRRPVCKSPIQSSILDYIETSKVTVTPTKNHNMSLFDYDQFSPIKKRPTPENKENANRKILTPRRSNLSPLKESNVLNVPSLNASVITPDRSDPEGGPENYFGFESSISFIENNENKRKKKKVLFASDTNAVINPTRLSINQIRRVFPKKKDTIPEVNETCYDTMQGSSSEDEQNTEDIYPSPESEIGDLKVGIFEDIESSFNNPTQRSYVCKRPRRQRLMSFESTHSEDYDDKPRRKKKDARTKAEEEEAEKWAAAFNSMCQEVDQHTLEIE